MFYFIGILFCKFFESKEKQEAYDIHERTMGMK